MNATIRPARPEDGDALRSIEWRAGEQFRAAGMDRVADDEPMSVDVLAGFAAAGRGWVAVDDRGDPVGYVVVSVLDGAAHVEQVSVDPAHQGRGVGRALLDVVGAWATERQLPTTTLTTFADVPWNGPLYRHLGFTEMSDDDIGPELAATLRHERDLGLDALGRRIAMCRPNS